jgi:hypothetical protein
MGLALETIVGSVPSLTGSGAYDALTNNANQSFVVRSYEAGSNAYLEDIWTAGAAHPTALSIKSPRLHDDVLGIQLWSQSLLSGLTGARTNPQTLLPGYLTQKLYSTDTLGVTATGTASDAFVGVFNVRYENLGGVNARLFSWPQVQAQIVNLVGFEVDCTASGTVGLFGPGQALNSTTARQKANTDYAWLGYTLSVPVSAVVMNGVDVGNLSVGGPGSWNIDDIGTFFVNQSVQYGIAHIPVINSLNFGGTFVSVADVEASTAVKVSIFMAELGTRLGTP